MSVDKSFTKDNLENYLKELAKEFKKLNGKSTPAEIILIGGASVLLNYGFREMTYDMDAIIRASSSMKDAINHVGDKYGLPNGWLNTDFVKTASYTPKLVQYSKYYKTFAKVLEIRTVSAEYLIAMKLMAGRKYKNDLSDIIGILAEQQGLNKPIDLECIQRAVCNLYDSYDSLPEASRTFIESAFQIEDLKAFYEKCRMDEKENKSILVEFQEDYPGVTNQDNIEEILKSIKEKKQKQIIDSES